MQIGRYITARGGVVAADELAPYLDLPSSKSSRVCFAYNKNEKDNTFQLLEFPFFFLYSQSDESYILPVLLRFDGQPELDEEVYTFWLQCFRW